jgi:hypothetical protein
LTESGRFDTIKQDSKRINVIGGIPSGKGSTLHFLEKKEDAGNQYKHIA